MAYTKPQVVAQNSAAGSYAAGCPQHMNFTPVRGTCDKCERLD